MERAEETVISISAVDMAERASHSLNAASAELYHNGYFESPPELCLILWPVSKRWSVVIRGSTGVTKNLVLELPLSNLELSNRMLDYLALVHDIQRKIDALDGEDPKLADLASSHSASLIKLLQ